MTTFLIILLYVAGGLGLLALLILGLLLVMTVRTEEANLDELRRLKRETDADHHAANEAVRQWRARRETQAGKTQDASAEEEAAANACNPLQARVVRGEEGGGRWPSEGGGGGGESAAVAVEEWKVDRMMSKKEASAHKSTFSMGGILKDTNQLNPNLRLVKVGKEFALERKTVAPRKPIPPARLSMQDDPRQMIKAFALPDDYYQWVDTGDGMGRRNHYKNRLLRSSRQIQASCGERRRSRALPSRLARCHGGRPEAAGPGAGKRDASRRRTGDAGGTQENLWQACPR